MLYYIPSFSVFLVLKNSCLADTWVKETKLLEETAHSACTGVRGHHMLWELLKFCRASCTTLSVSLLWSDFIQSLKSLNILVYLSWHMLWHTPSLVVWVLRCSILGEETLNFLVWVDTETFLIGWGIVGISWLELTASVSGSGS